eukprot:301886-Pelagomonas_calceolata.AAC.2
MQKFEDDSDNAGLAEMKCSKNDPVQKLKCIGKEWCNAGGHWSLRLGSVRAASLLQLEKVFALKFCHVTRLDSCLRRGLMLFA